MDVLALHRQLIDDHAAVIRSFMHVSDDWIAATTDEVIGKGAPWAQVDLQFGPRAEDCGL